MYKCCICGKSIDMLEVYFPFSGGQSMYLCQDCYKVYKNLKSSQPNYEAAEKYFHGFFEQDLADLNAIPVIEAELAAAKDRLHPVQKKQFPLTTGVSFEGYTVTKYITVVSGECVMGTGPMSGLSASISNMTGTTSPLFEEKLNVTKQEALRNMIDTAAHLGANAILGVDFDVLTIAAGMFVVSANGTAVIIEKNTES